MDYTDFIDSKGRSDAPTGISGEASINAMLFDFQKDIVKWAIKRGRACIFADCGMGKTPMQLEWASHVSQHTSMPVLIVAPLAVSDQTIREGVKFGIDVNKLNNGSPCGPGIHVTNYEQLHKADAAEFGGIVLDESSILKSYTGKFRTYVIEEWGAVPFRLACTATPSPNDFMELGNHSEFMGVMKREEMLSMFFVHDGGDTSKWRIKGHARQEFWRWVCSWAVMIRKPSDLGYDDGDFTLPDLVMHEKIVAVDENESDDGLLFRMPASSLSERQKERKMTISKRVSAAADLVAMSDDHWLIWCNLNSESTAIVAAIDGAVEVTGSDSAESKSRKMLDFSAGKIRVLVTKPRIAGFGMNWQHCKNMAFVGLSDSYEQFYQAVRRCYRFGQTKDVHCHVITASTEGAVVQNIKRKEKQAAEMADEMVLNMHVYNESNIKGLRRDYAKYMTDNSKSDRFSITLGDCVEGVSGLADDSIGFSIFSPPFASLYTYSNSDRDMGNSSSYDEFFSHFNYLAHELYRVTKPGRLMSFHCMNLPTSKTKHGYIGIQDFRGHLIKMFQETGFIYHSEVCIWKDPVVAMQRTKALGLLHKQIKKDSCMSRQGIPDYLVTMRKPGENPDRVSGEFTYFAGDKDTFKNTGNLSIDIWQRYASPIWTDINPSRTLQHRSARDHDDERHICPLQLDVIERAMQMWSKDGDLVLSPFAGIGSEGHVAIKMGRKFIGFELKQSYYDQAVKNLAAAEAEMGADLFGDAL